MAKAFPTDLTSYDLLKATAVILMVIDHIGWYFFPEVQWLRVLGRLCVPIWFFLVGYADSRDIGARLWVGGLILVAGNALAGMYLIPLNILFSILVVRLTLDTLMEYAKTSVNTMAVTTVGLMLLIVPASFLWEYGTQGLMLAMVGYVIRHKDYFQTLHKDTVEVFLMAQFAIFVLSQVLFFNFQNMHYAGLAAGLLAVFWVLWTFTPKTYPALTQKLPGVAVTALQVLGRRTLEIYVVHLLVFKAMAMVLFPENYQFLDWSLFDLPRAE